MDDYNNQNNFTPNNQNDYNQNNQQPYQYDMNNQNNQYNQPYQYPQYQDIPEPGKNFAIASLILSIVSIVCCGNTICAILGIVFGVISRQRQKENNGMATAGIVISIITLVLGIIGIIFAVAAGILETYTYSYFY